MKLQTLKIENFLAIGRVKCRLDDRGLVLISGDNRDDSSQDSNGAGKSTVADALSFCLYGTTARGESGDSVINRVAKKDCMVSVDILEGEAIYRITRHRKHHKEKNRLMVLKLDDKTGHIDDLTKGTDKLTQDLVNQIVGCSVDVFNAAIYAGQEKMPDLPGMTDKQLKLLVEEAAGIDRLQQAEIEARNRLRDIKSEFQAISTELEMQRRQIERLNENVAADKRESERWQQQHKERLALKGKALLEAKKDYEALTECVTENSPKLKAVEVELLSIQKKLEGAAAEQEGLAELDELVRRRELELERQKALIKNQVALIKRYQVALDQLDGRVGKPCGECGKPYKPEDLSDARVIAEKNLADSKNQGKELSEQVKKLSESASEALQQREDYKRSMTSYSDENKRMDELRALQSDYQKAARQQEQSAGTLKRMMDELKQIKAEINPHDAVLERDATACKEAQWQFKELQDRREVVTGRIRVAEEVCRIFGAAGVRAYILDTVTPFLNQRTAHYLHHLTDGNIQAHWTTLSTTKKGELRENFTIDVNSSVGAASFKGLSGGEKRKVRLACSMALQDLVASRATKPIELYIADEIDHALDDSGLERLMTILDEKSKERGTVLVISHSDLSDWIRQQVTVIKESGQSRMEGVALA